MPHSNLSATRRRFPASYIASVQSRSVSNCLTAVLVDSGTCCCPCFSRSSLPSFAEIRAGRLTPVAGVYPSPSKTPPPASLYALISIFP
ncbi:hypothetical protein V6N11_071191 [Hibiscus sabdariffa]|uniref:Uncharacterized protein n=1 Tax=Hibiscus sabdariffa TaxID=183260 RepID=A0ABR2TZC7_9ROSI